MLALDTDTTEDQIGVLSGIYLFATDCALSNFAQIDEDLAVEHTVSVKIH